MPDDVFHRLMSIHDGTYSHLFSDEVFGNNDCSKYYISEYLKMSYGEGLECPDEGIQSASNLKYSGTVELDLSGSNYLVWVSTEDTSNYGIDHTTDVDSDRDSMEGFPQCLLDIQIDNEEQDSSQTKPFDNSWDPKIAMCKEAHTMSVYSTSCPNRPPSLNYEFGSNFQVSSTPDKLFYKYLNNNHEYGYENIWSILTNEISYTIDKNLYTNIKYKPTQMDGIYYTNISLYNPDNSNEPCSVKKNTITSLPNSKQHFNADNNTIPFENDSYPGLSTVLTEEFRPNIDICATYLWSHPQAMSYNSHSSWFKLGHFPFNRCGITVGRLLDGTKMSLHFDKIQVLLNQG